MQARHSSSAQPHWPSRLVLWLAVGLFVFQVALHASTPASLSMAGWLDHLMTAPAAAPHPDPMSGMADMARGNEHQQPASTPGRPGHAGHPDGLCCMPTAALLPTVWGPPLVPPGRRTLRPAKALHEALRILRATARGPPSWSAAPVQTV